MKKLASTLPNMLLSLTAICCVAAALLSFVHESTRATISAQELNALQNGINKVTPSFDNSPYEEKITVTFDGDEFVIYPAKKGETLQGAAVESVSHNGFSGDVRVLVGLDMDGKVVDYTVLEQAETPGLGAEMDQFFRETDTGHFIPGISVTTPLSVTKDGGTVDAITAATISSRAFLETINKAYAAYQLALDQNLLSR